MAATERELAEDAQWKRIQQNTFTRWANEHLKQVSKHIGNLETDLSDGLRLIALIEVLSGKHLPKHNKRPNFKSQKLENVSVALQFLERDENIRIINIGEYCVLLCLPVCCVYLCVLRDDNIRSTNTGCAGPYSQTQTFPTNNILQDCQGRRRQLLGRQGAETCCLVVTLLETPTTATATANPSS